jgi:hypothetical protein
MLECLMHLLVDVSFVNAKICALTWHVQIRQKAPSADAKNLPSLCSFS